MASLISGHELEQTLGDSEGQGDLSCCSPWGHKESDTTERLNNSSCFSICILLLTGLFENRLTIWRNLALK